MERVNGKPINIPIRWIGARHLSFPIFWVVYLGSAYSLSTRFLIPYSRWGPFERFFRVGIFQFGQETLTGIFPNMVNFGTTPKGSFRMVRMRPVF